MNNETINKIFLKSKNKMRIKGRSDTMAELLPYFLMDECFDLYQKHIKDISCCYNLKREKNKWREGWTSFNRTFSCYYTEAQRDYIFEKMDDFERYIRNTVDTLLERIKEGLTYNKVEFQFRDSVATCLLCNVLTQMAQIQWGNVNQTPKGEHEHNRDIEKVQKATIAFAYNYYKPMTDIDINKFEGINEGMKELCHIAVEWLANDAEMESKKKPSMLGWNAWRNRHKGEPMKMIRKFVDVNETLLMYGYELFDEVRGFNLFRDRKPKSVAEDRIEEESDTRDYEYVFVDKRCKNHEKEDVMAIYRKKREDAV